MDIKNAFLYDDLPKDVDIEQPSRYAAQKELVCNYIRQYMNSSLQLW